MSVMMPIAWALPRSASLVTVAGLMSTDTSGIEAEKIDSVFERYFSLRPDDGIGSDRAVEHSGLGLWIVRRNVEALGGQVIAANRSGGGLSIRMLLPRFVIH
jgi:signal transduction histidine kinase